MKRMYIRIILLLVFVGSTWGLFAQNEVQNPSSPFWKVRGNTGTHTGINFIGTTDNFSLAFRTNNLQRMTIDSLGKVGIGVSLPLQRLHVAGTSSTLRLGGLGISGGFINTTSSSTDKLLFADANGDLYAIPNGSNGQVLTISSGGPAWTSSTSSGGWDLTGNSGTNIITNFLGTTDAADLIFKVNATRAGLLERSTTGNTFYGFKAGEVWNSGGENVLLGTRTAEGWSGGNRNTMVGMQAGAGIFGTVRNDNTLLGYQAGFTVDINGLTAIGSQAGYLNQYGLFNTYVGYRAGYNNRRGSYNVFLGDSAGLSLDIMQIYANAEQNIFVGSKAGRDVRQGVDNVVMGYMTGMFEAGNGNTLLGSQASSGLFGVNSLNGTTAVGYRAGYNAAVGQNTYVGYMSGFNQRNSTSVTAIGYAAGYGTTSLTASNSVYLGDSAGYAGNSNYYQNTFVGSKAGREVSSGNNNVALGFRAMSNMFNLNANISNSVAIGSEAGHESGNASNSVFVGYRSGYSGYSNDENIFVGSQSGANFHDLHKNTFLGNNLINNNSTYSNRNVVVGYQAVMAINNSDENIVIGNSTSSFMQTASQNVVIGPNIVSVSNAQNNVAVGNAISFSSSQNSTFIGSGATAFSNVTNATALGANTIVSQNNTVILGNNADVGIGTSTPARKLHVSGTNSTIRIGGIANGGLFESAASSNTSRIVYADVNGDLFAVPSGTNGQVLTYSNSGPVWSGGSSSGTWNTTGNSGTNTSTHFVGTTDNNGLRFKVNNAHAGLLDHISNNTLFGISAGNAITSGTKNTYLGASAGLFSTGGSNNSYIGFEAGRNTSTGFSNVAMGIHSLRALTTAFNTVAIGDSALLSNTTGAGNTAVGSKALMSNVTGAQNTVLGYQALKQNTGARNTAMGYNAGNGVTAASTDNTLIGNGILNGSAAGSQNTVIGSLIAATQTVGNNNLLAGYSVPGSAFSIGNNNVIAGQRAGNQLNGTVGDDNVFIGNLSGISGSSSSSSSNVVIGASAQAVDPATLGVTNAVLIGNSATSQGSINNTVIGASAKSTFTNTTTGSTVIGALAQVSLANNFILGDTINRPLVGIGVTAVGKTLSGTRFEIASEGTTDNLLYRYQGSGTPTFTFQRSTGTLNTPGTIANSNTIGALDYYGYDGNSWEHTASISVICDTTVADEQLASRIVFSTRFALGTFPIEVARINRNGYLGIGTTDPDTRLAVSGGISAIPVSATLTADNQVVNVGDRTYIRINSSATTATTRTIVLTDGLEIGQLLILTATATNTGLFELIDEDTQAGTNTQTGSASLTFDAQDAATFIWDGTDWVMLSFRSNN